MIIFIISSLFFFFAYYKKVQHHPTQKKKCYSIRMPCRPRMNTLFWFLDPHPLMLNQRPALPALLTCPSLRKGFHIHLSATIFRLDEWTNFFVFSDEWLTFRMSGRLDDWMDSAERCVWMSGRQDDWMVDWLAYIVEVQISKVMSCIFLKNNSRSRQYIVEVQISTLCHANF